MMNEKESRARQFFEQIVNAPDPAAFLRGLVDEHKCENDFLEFKGAGNINPKQAKEYWSRALSGFANTEGGVLIWGIRATRVSSPDDPAQRIDAAESLDLVPAPESFMQMLKDVKLEATVHPVAGVEYEFWDAAEGNGSGFVVCLIPEGANKPYRAELDPARQYYQRIGDSFVVIPHSLLASLFYPRSTPKLQVALTSVKETEVDSESAVPDRKSEYVFDASLTNCGTGSAHDVLVTVRTNYPADWAEQECLVPANRRRGKNQRKFLAVRPIHPDEEPIHCLRCTVEAPTHLRFQKETRLGIRDAQRVVFEVGIYARDAEPVRSVVAFEGDDFSVGKTKATQLG